MTSSIQSLNYILIISLFSTLPASAKWGTLNITDEHGDQVQVKHGLLGKKIVVKDRNGNGFGHSRSIFGITKKTEVGVLGNDVGVSKSWFGFGKVEGHDTLGDTISSKKNPLFRNTNVNLSGADALLTKLSSTKPPLSPNSSNIPGQVPATPVNSSATYPAQ